MTSPPPCFPLEERREFLEVPSRLGRCFLRVVCSVRRPRWIHNPTPCFQWFIHRNSFRLSKDDGNSIRRPHLSYNSWASSRCGSRIHTDGFPKWAPKAQASRGESGDMLPSEKFLDFLLPKVSFPGFLSYSDRIIGKRSTFYHLKCIHIWKIWPLFVKSWTPMWFRAWVHGVANR